MILAFVQMAEQLQNCSKWPGLQLIDNPSDVTVSVRGRPSRIKALALRFRYNWQGSCLLMFGCTMTNLTANPASIRAFNRNNRRLPPSIARLLLLPASITDAMAEDGCAMAPRNHAEAISYRPLLITPDGLLMILRITRIWWLSFLLGLGCHSDLLPLIFPPLVNSRSGD